MKELILSCGGGRKKSPGVRYVKKLKVRQCSALQSCLPVSVLFHLVIRQQLDPEAADLREFATGCAAL